jgi:exodeoxyribonuclease VIII
MKNHAMIDLETLGVGPRAAILTIGWCIFDPWGELGETGKMQINIQSCIQRGMVVNDSTFRWWLTQSQDARNALLEFDPCDLAEGLYHLSDILEDVEYVWGNGANFDISILDTAHELCQMEAPWKFYNVRCYRTLKSMFPSVPKVKPTVAHCAAADAKAQAEHLINIYREHGI